MALESGAGVPEIVRAAARALEDASLVLIDRSARSLAVAARCAGRERRLLRRAAAWRTHELRVAERARRPAPDALAARAGPGGADGGGLVRTLIASELARVRAPARASEEASTDFARDLPASETDLVEPD